MSENLPKSSCEHGWCQGKLWIIMQLSTYVCRAISAIETSPEDGKDLWAGWPVHQSVNWLDLAMFPPSCTHFSPVQTENLQNWFFRAYSRTERRMSVLNTVIWTLSLKTIPTALTMLWWRLDYLPFSAFAPRLQVCPYLQHGFVYCYVQHKEKENVFSKTSI